MATLDYSIKDVEKLVTGIHGTIKKVDVSRLTAIGENYLSLVFRVDFEVENNGQIETVSTVAKRLPIGGDKKFNFNAIAMKNEIRWYTEIVPLLKDFGKEYGIDLDYYPEYLGSRLSLDPSKEEADEESVLILRNLIPDGYKNEDRYIGFDLTATTALLRVLANFHAIPLAMKFKKPELFKIVKDYLESCHIRPPPPPPGKDGHPDGPPRGKHLSDEKLFEKLLEIPACQPYRAKIEVLKQQPHGLQNWHKTGKEPWNTITHSDYWVNNVMVKSRAGEEPLVKMVDFQMSCYSSYAKDLVFFLLSSVRNDIQKREFDSLLRFYYNELTSILEKINIPELKLSYEDYLDEVKRVALESETSHAICFSTVIFGTKGTGPDILIGEMDMFDHMDYMINNMNDHQKEKLAVIIELADKKGWL